MKLQPIVYVTDMQRSVEWYTQVLDTPPAYSSEVWTAIVVGDATLGIHHTDNRSAESNSQLSIIAEQPLEDIATRLTAAGIPIDRAICDEPFGRSLVVRDPDGSPVQINEQQ